jgi:hypothetical protein
MFGLHQEAIEVRRLLAPATVIDFFSGSTVPGWSTGFWTRMNIAADGLGGR